MRGDYNGHKAFLGLIHAMVQKVNCEQHGVGMQNFAYAPAWDEFVGIHSLRAHKFLASHFQA